MRTNRAVQTGHEHDDHYEVDDDVDSGPWAHGEEGAVAEMNRPASIAWARMAMATVHRSQVSAGDDSGTGSLRPAPGCIFIRS